MVTELTANSKLPFVWLDIVSPQADELQEIARQYSLHEESMADCMQPSHLPKYERLKNYTFIIFRVYAFDNEKVSDTVQEMTNKIAIFVGGKFIITIHTREWKPINQISRDMLESNDFNVPADILNEILLAGLHTYDEPGNNLTKSIEYYEKHIFLKSHYKAPLIKGLYYVKRKTDVIKRILLLSYDIIDKIDKPEATNAYTRDIRDLFVKQRSLFESLAENTNQLLNMYFNVSAHRTNETIRVLTIFSVFFMPLTFIVGVYGMNFEYLPEFKWKFGYAYVILLMAGVTAGIYFWFKKRRWM